MFGAQLTPLPRVKEPIQDKLDKLRHVNKLMREMLEYQRRSMASLGIRPAKFPDFVYEVI